MPAPLSRGWSDYREPQRKKIAPRLLIMPNTLSGNPALPPLPPHVSRAHIFRGSARFTGFCMAPSSRALASLFLTNKVENKASKFLRLLASCVDTR